VAFPTKQCRECGGTFDEEAGFGRRKQQRYTAAKPVCLICEQTKRDTEKRANRWRDKIRDTMRHHSKALQIPASQLLGSYGWNLDRMEHDARHAYENSCPYCRVPFVTMGHGLNDITLDIHDPTVAAPYYSTNTRWICLSCNKHKSRTPPTLWARRRIYHDQYQAWQDAGGARAWALRQSRFEWD
jgi:hypothetical protein